MNSELLPIIVGVGQINDRPAVPSDGMDPVALMVAALERAQDDAGARLIADADFLATVMQIGFRDMADTSGPLADALKIRPKECLQSVGPNGDSPILLLNEAANRIGAGEAKVALVVGAEALRTAAARIAAEQQGRKFDATREASHRKRVGYAQSYGLVAPVDVYPLYENGLRASTGQTFAQSQAESGLIWSMFSEVAAGNPNAWIRKAISSEDVLTPNENNRPIAWPYTKLTVANSSVNQGAGFIVTSVGEARRRGIPEDKWVYVGNGAAAHEEHNILKRDRFDRSPSMAVSIEKAMELNALEIEDLSAVELYSCFPCVPKMARRVLGWPADRPASVFGGLTFGGGPIGNYMSHAVASMVDKLRDEGGIGLLFANGGFATHNHTLPLSSRPIPAARFPRDFDFQAEADAIRGTVPDLDRDYRGTATVESYTVFFRRDGSPRSGVIVALTPAGRRTLAQVPPDDAITLSWLMNAKEEPVGQPGLIIDGALGPDGETRLGRWQTHEPN